jgi:predicted permease
MPTGGGWRKAFRFDRGRAPVERDVDDELTFHLEAKVAHLVAAGWDPVAARRKAEEAFGDVSGVRQECLALDHRHARARRWTDRLSSLRQDARYAFRTLARQPAFAITAILLLAVGIGANTAVFTVVDALLLRPLPVPDPERLVTIGDPAAVDDNWMGSPMTRYVSYPVYADIQDQNDVLAGVYATGLTGDLDVVVDEGSGVEHPQGRLVSGNFFSVLGVPARIGRTFSDADDRIPLGDPVVVISDQYWRDRFGAGRSVIGRSIRVNGASLTIIGVTPPGFTGDIVAEPSDLWIPMMMQPAISRGQSYLSDRAWSWLLLMGRLKQGVTLGQARSELAGIELRSIRSHLSGAALSEFDDDRATDPVRIGSGARGLSRYRSDYASALAVLMAAAALLALIVSVNVANLLLARAVARAPEMTVRMSLGAARGRLIRQLLTESGILASCAALLGLVSAFGGSRLLLTASGDLATALDVSPNLRMLLFTAGVTLLSVLLFGLVPAFRATRTDLATSLRAAGRNLSGAGDRLGPFAVGRLLVVAQVALSMLLLISTGLLVRSMRRILTTDLGLSRDRLVLMNVRASRGGYSGARAGVLLRELMDRVGAVPGVVAVSYSWNGIFSGGRSQDRVTIPGFVPPADSETHVSEDYVGPGYFHALGARVVRGRDLDARDDAAGAKVVVINETAARQYFPGQDPLGRTIVQGGVPFTIVGVVRDIEEQDVRGKATRWVYYSMHQREVPGHFFLEVRVAGDPSRLVSSLRTTLLAVDPHVPFSIHPLNDLVRATVAQNVLVTQVTAVFGMLALLLAALGLYGVTTYATSRRTAELGLRLALGAHPGWLLRMVIREGAALAGLGVLVGVPAGLAASRLLRTQLFGVGPFDLPSLAAAVVVLLVTALVAAYLPARRAAATDPLVALRAE